MASMLQVGYAGACERPSSLFLAPLRRIRAAMLKTKLLRSVPQHAARSWVLDHMPRSEAPWQGTPAAVMLGR